MAEEADLITRLGRSPRRDTHERNSIRRYGPVAPYDDNWISKEIPPHLQALADRLVERRLAPPATQVSVNEYLAGQSIDFHTDGDSSGPVISILAILSDATFRLRRMDATADVYAYVFPRRALLQLSGDARHRPWQHAVDPVAADRISIVFRPA